MFSNFGTFSSKESFLLKDLLGNNHLGFEGQLDFCHELERLNPF
jgi:hypothetical protein